MITVSATNSFVGVRGIIFDIVNTKSHNVKNVLPWKKFINNRNKVVEKSSYRKINVVLLCTQVELRDLPKE